MKNINYSFFVILMVLFFCFNTAFAGRYICVDENDKEVECIPQKIDGKKAVRVSKPSYRTKGKPAGRAYQYHKKKNTTKKK